MPIGLRRPRHLQRAPADEPGAEQRRERRGIAALGQRETVGSVGDRMGGVAAVARIAGEERIVAKIFARAHAIGAMPAGMAEPGHADARVRAQKPVTPAPDRVDAADDFMAGNDRELRLCQLAVDDMEIGAADAAGLDLAAAASPAPGAGSGRSSMTSGVPGPPQDHGGHLRHLVTLARQPLAEEDAAVARRKIRDSRPPREAAAARRMRRRVRVECVDIDADAAAVRARGASAFSISRVAEALAAPRLSPTQRCRT